MIKKKSLLLIHFIKKKKKWGYFSTKISERGKLYSTLTVMQLVWFGCWHRKTLMDTHHCQKLLQTKMMRGFRWWSQGGISLEEKQCIFGWLPACLMSLCSKGATCQNKARLLRRCLEEGYGEVKELKEGDSVSGSEVSHPRIQLNPYLLLSGFC